MDASDPTGWRNNLPQVNRKLGEQVYAQGMIPFNYPPPLMDPWPAAPASIQSMMPRSDATMDRYIALTYNRVKRTLPIEGPTPPGGLKVLLPSRVYWVVLPTTTAFPATADVKAQSVAVKDTTQKGVDTNTTSYIQDPSRSPFAFNRPTPGAYQGNTKIIFVNSGTAYNVFVVFEAVDGSTPDERAMLTIDAGTKEGNFIMDESTTWENGLAIENIGYPATGPPIRGTSIQVG